MHLKKTNTYMHTDRKLRACMYIADGLGAYMTAGRQCVSPGTVHKHGHPGGEGRGEIGGAWPLAVGLAGQSYPQLQRREGRTEG